MADRKCPSSFAYHDYPAEMSTEAVSEAYWWLIGSVYMYQSTISKLHPIAYCDSGGVECAVPDPSCDCVARAHCNEMVDSHSQVSAYARSILEMRQDHEWAAESAKYKGYSSSIGSSKSFRRLEITLTALMLAYAEASMRVGSGRNGGCYTCEDVIREDPYHGDESKIDWRRIITTARKWISQGGNVIG